MVLKERGIETTTEDLKLCCRLDGGYRTEISGHAWLLGVRVSGQVDLSGSQIKKNLILQAAKIEGALDCKPEKGCHTVIGGNVWLTGAKVSILADFSGAQIKRDLVLEGTEIAGGLFCGTWKDPCTQKAYPTEIGEKVSLLGTKILGHVGFNGAQVKGDLFLQGAEINGKLDCKTEEGYCTKVGCNASLAGAKVSGEVDFSEAEVNDSLLLQGAKIDGDLHCTCTKVGKKARLTGAKVSGDVNFSEAKVTEELDLEGTEIKGDLIWILDEGIGNANLRACSVRCMNLHVKLPSDRNVELLSNPILNLARTQIIELEIKGNIPSEINLDGCQFQKLTLPVTEENKVAYLDSLLKLLEATQPFRKSTYLFVEKWLRNRVRTSTQIAFTWKCDVGID